RFHPRKSSNPPPRPTDFPALGAVLHRVRPARGFPCSAMHLNGPLLAPQLAAPGQYGGVPGPGVAPVTPGAVSGEAGGRAGVGRRDPSRDLAPVRLDRRRSLLANVDRNARALEADRATLDHSAARRQAYDLLASPRGRALFDLSREPEALRDAYGRHRSGQ